MTLLPIDLTANPLLRSGKNLQLDTLCHLIICVFLVRIAFGVNVNRAFILFFVYFHIACS